MTVTWPGAMPASHGVGASLHGLADAGDQLAQRDRLDVLAAYSPHVRVAATWVGVLGLPLLALDQNEAILGRLDCLADVLDVFGRRPDAGLAVRTGAWGRGSLVGVRAEPAAAWAQWAMSKATKTRDDHWPLRELEIGSPTVVHIADAPRSPVYAVSHAYIVGSDEDHQQWAELQAAAHPVKAWMTLVWAAAPDAAGRVALADRGRKVAHGLHLLPDGELVTLAAATGVPAVACSGPPVVQFDRRDLPHELATLLGVRWST